MSNPWTTDNPATGNQNNPNTTVTISPVPTDDFDARVIPPDSDQDIYTSYKISNRYVNPQRRYMLGITSPAGFNGQSAAFVQLASQTMLWITDWTALKTNSKPKIPFPTPADDRWVLLAKYWTPAMVIPNPTDGVTPLFRISGTYIFGLKDPSEETLVDTTFPRPPWAEDVPAWRHPTEDMFEASLSDALE